MLDASTTEFLVFRIGSIGVMERVTTQIAQVVETILETVMEIVRNIEDPFMEANVNKRHLMISSLSDMIDNLMAQAHDKVDGLATEFVSTMVSSSGEWVNTLEVTGEQFEQALDVIEQNILADGYNAIDENVPYFKKEVLKGINNTVINPDPATFIEDVFESLIYDGVVDYEA